jgi:hypothetical protein
MDMSGPKKSFQNMDILERHGQKDAPELLKRLVQHEFFDYALEKLFKANITVHHIKGGIPSRMATAGSPSHIMKRAFSKNHDPEKIEDLKIRKLVEDNREWFETISFENSGFNPKLNAEMIRTDD